MINKYKGIVLLILLMVLFLSGCSGPSRSQVKRDAYSYVEKWYSTLSGRLSEEARKSIRESPLIIDKIEVDPYEKDIAIAVVRSKALGGMSFTLVYRKTSYGWKLHHVE